MSRTSRDSGSSSPIKKYLSFTGSKGQFKFYDKNHKDADEKGHVYIPEAKIIVLDVKASVSGYNENASSGINSNLLDPYSVGKEKFVVKTKINGKFGVFAEGIYKDIKEKLATIGAKYTTNVFALVDLGDGYEMTKLELNGSALSPWIKLVDGLGSSEEIYDLEVTGAKGDLLTRKVGKTVKVTKAEYKKVVDAVKKDPMYQRPVWFYEPSFTVADLGEELSELAIEQDKLLQAYFDASGVKTELEEIEVKHEEVSSKPLEPAENTEEEDDDDLPF